MVQAAAADNGSVTYTFTAGSPGTYLYESGTDVDKQVQMGLYGALVVRPAGHPSQVNDRADSAFNADNEYVFLLSEVDPDLHLAVERERAGRLERVQRALLHDQRPQHAGHAGARTTPRGCPPSRTARWCTSSRTTRRPTRCPAMIRYLNAGTVNYPFHPHGSDERVVNKDGQCARRGRPARTCPT